MSSESRTRLLEQAQTLFAQRGYDAVGVQEIVAAAGLTKPSLYHWFGSKRGLLDALVAGSGEELEKRLTEAALYEGDLPATLDRVVQAWFGFAREHPQFQRLLLALAVAPPEHEGHEAIRALTGRIRKTLEKLFRSAARDHGNMRGRHAAYAATLTGAVGAWVGLYLAGEVELDDGLARRAARQFQHGIYS